MALSSIVRKIRMWGLKGILGYFRARLENRRWHRYFAKNSRLLKGEPVRGITVVGALSSQGSVHKSLRDFCYSLKDVGVPFQTFDLGRHEVPLADIQSILTPREEFRINKYTHLVEMLSSPVQNGLVPHRGRIVFWEFEDGIVEAYPTLVERSGDVLAMSDFNYEYYRSEFSGRRAVRKILYPLRLDVSQVHEKEICRARWGLKKDEFVVFYNFSYASGWNRKNPLSVVQTFAKAFRDDSQARLILKTASRSAYEENAEKVERCAREEGILDRVTFVDEYLSQAELYDLTNACDVYLSLHRSEGFGLGIAEAMMLGKAVVVTAYSAPLEFCNSENSILVPYEMVKVDCSDVPWYASASQWAEPNVDVAAAALKRLRMDPELLKKLGDNACRTLKDRFSLDNFLKSLLSYLDESSKEGAC